MASPSITDVCSSIWRASYGHFGQLWHVFLEKVEQLTLCGFINTVSISCRLKRGEEVKDTDRVKTVENLQIQLYVELLRILCNSAWHIVIVVLKPAGQSIAMGI